MSGHREMPPLPFSSRSHKAANRRPDAARGLPLRRGPLLQPRPALSAAILLGAALWLTACFEQPPSLHALASAATTATP
jgi:hypothetical protein